MSMVPPLLLALPVIFVLTFDPSLLLVARIDNPLDHVFVIPPGDLRCPGFNLTSDTARGKEEAILLKKKKEREFPSDY